MGVVYRAYDPELDREVAMKSVRLEGVTPEQRATNEQYLAREARAAARLQHPHAVAVYDFFSSGDRAFIVMEFIRGSNLDALLATGDTSNTALTLRILREAASALDAAHMAGIVHRDIKPGNILLDEAGRVKLADFGIARLSGGSMQTEPSVGATSGTLSYMSPEQIRGEHLDGRSDQFALAVVAYQLLTGVLPFHAETWVAQSFKILNEQPRPVRAINPTIPASAEAALNIALSKDRNQRFPTCMDFVNALSGAAVAKPKPKVRPAAILALAALCSLMVLGISYRFIRQLEGASSTAPPSSTQNTLAPASQPSAPATPPPAAAPPANPGAESLSLVLDGIPMDFARIEPGRFLMGCNTCEDAQRPEHMVEITRGFQLGRTEVTEKHWNAVMTGKAAGSNKPKVQVSWNDTQAFLAKLNALGDGFRYRLPTEAEWEYAARANDPGERPRNLGDLAWTSSNSGDKLQDVASTKISNGWGLYDMLGNASEWTNDWLDLEYYRNSPLKDPKGAATGTMRMIRGGNGGIGDMLASYAYRAADQPSGKGPWLGFRVARERK